MTDTLTPNYLIVNPDGTTAAKFSGAVTADGFEFIDPVRGFSYILSSPSPATGQPMWTLKSTWADMKAFYPTWASLKAGAPSWTTARQAAA